MGSTGADLTLSHTLQSGCDPCLQLPSSPVPYQVEMSFLVLCFLNSRDSCFHPHPFLMFMAEIQRSAPLQSELLSFLSWGSKRLDLAGELVALLITSIHLARKKKVFLPEFLVNYKSDSLDPVGLSISQPFHPCCSPTPRKLQTGEKAEPTALGVTTSLPLQGQGFWLWVRRGRKLHY